jgi:hypothetical protein
MLTIVLDRPSVYQCSTGWDRNWQLDGADRNDEQPSGLSSVDDDSTASSREARQHSPWQSGVQ